MRGPYFGLPLETCIFAAMFDGAPIPPSAYDAAGPLWAILAAIIGATAALRTGFGREWSCVTGAQFLPWRDGGTSEHREGGSWLVLLLGVFGWMFAWSAWTWSHGPANTSVAWSALGIGLLWGVGTECCRWVGARFGAWLTFRPDLLAGMTRMDRRLRVWWTWGSAVLWLSMVVRFPTAEALQRASEAVVGMWVGWLILKWTWVLIRVVREGVHLGWGFAYLCTLEIIPSASLAGFVWKVWS